MKNTPKRNQEIMYVAPEKSDALDALSKATRVPKQVYLREALDDLLNKYQVRDTPSPASIPPSRKQKR